MWRSPSNIRHSCTTLSLGLGGVVGGGVVFVGSWWVGVDQDGVVISKFGW